MTHDFRWDALAADGSVMTGEHVPAPSFPTQSEAESWLGEEWEHLVAAGVDAVVLRERGESVYGPMSLRPEE